MCQKPLLCFTKHHHSEIAPNLTVRSPDVLDLDGRNRTIVIAELPARVIVAIQIASVRWPSYLPPPENYRKISPHRPCVRRAALRIARLAFTGLTCVPRGTAEWLARVDRLR